jgi:hypothetical protein
MKGRDEMDEMKEFLDNSEFLPEFMRDFHDAKSLFKLLDRAVQARNTKDHIQLPNWIAAQMYTVDVFLYFMAKRGYTLQKSRKKLPFADINETMAAFEMEREKLKYDAIKDLIGMIKKEKGE